MELIPDSTLQNNPHQEPHQGAIMANPFVYVELNTTDVSASKTFYTKLFDWKLEDVPGADYTFIKVGEGTGGGMMKHQCQAHPPCGCPTSVSTTSMQPQPRRNPSAQRSSSMSARSWATAR